MLFEIGDQSAESAEPLFRGNDAVTYAHGLIGKFFLRFFADRKERHKIVDAVFYRCDVFRHLCSVYKTIVGTVGIARNL